MQNMIKHEENIVKMWKNSNEIRRQRQKFFDPLLLGSQSRFCMSISIFGGTVK